MALTSSVTMKEEVDVSHTTAFGHQSVLSLSPNDIWSRWGSLPVTSGSSSKLPSCLEPTAALLPAGLAQPGILCEGSSPLPSRLHVCPAHTPLPQLHSYSFRSGGQEVWDQTDKQRQSAFSLASALCGSLLLLVVLGCGGHPHALHSECSWGPLGTPLGTSALQVPHTWVMHSDFFQSPHPPVARSPMVHLQPHSTTLPCPAVDFLPNRQ